MNDIIERLHEALHNHNIRTAQDTLIELTARMDRVLVSVVYFAIHRQEYTFAKEIAKDIVDPSKREKAINDAQSAPQR